MALILEYEDVLQRQRTELGWSQDDVTDFIDALCSMAHHHKICFLVPKYLHKQLRVLVQAEGISVNQFVMRAVAEKIVALSALEYLERRATGVVVVRDS